MAAHEWWALGITIQLITSRYHLGQLDVPEDIPAVIVIKYAECQHVLSIDTVEKIAEAYRLFKESA